VGTGFECCAHTSGPAIIANTATAISHVPPLLLGGH